jgi:hypothetical protein
LKGFIWVLKGIDISLLVFVGECQGIWHCGGIGMWKTFADTVSMKGFFDGLELVGENGSMAMDGYGNLVGVGAAVGFMAQGIALGATVEMRVGGSTS